MVRATCLVVAAFLASAMIPSAWAQERESDEVKRLKEKIELLEAKLEIAKRDKADLEKRFAQLEKKGKAATGTKSPDPSTKLGRVPAEVTQPKPSVIQNFHVRVVSCLQQGDELICTLVITDRVGKRALRSNNGGNATATFDNAKKIKQAESGTEIGEAKGYDLFQGVKLDKDVPVEMTIKFKDVPEGVSKIVLLDLGLVLGFNTNLDLKLRNLVIQRLADE